MAGTDLKLPPLDRDEVEALRDMLAICFNALCAGAVDGGSVEISMEAGMVIAELTITTTIKAKAHDHAE